MPGGNFLERVFPDEVSRGAVISPSFRTSVTQIASGHERRNATWEAPLTQFSISLGTQPLTEILNVYRLFLEAQGALVPFRMRNWLDYLSSQNGESISDADQTLSPILESPSDATTRRFQIRKEYSSVTSFVRDIRKPVDGSVIVSGFQESDYSVDYSTGIVSFDSAQSATRIITCGFEFHYPVRFLNDTADFVVETAESARTRTLTLQEVLLR